MVDIIFLALLSGVIVYRLYITLGRKEDDENKPHSFMSQSTKVFHQRKSDQRNEGHLKQSFFLSKELQALHPILQKDSSFKPEAFLKGAKDAFKLIVEAFAKGDRQTLKPLLSPSMYKNFIAAIKKREQKKMSQEITVEDIESVKVLFAHVQGDLAEITLAFRSKQISKIQHASGEVNETDPEFFDEARDTWTFARDLKSSNPNWQLVVVEEGED